MRIIIYRGASALGVLALFYWCLNVGDGTPILIGLFVFLAGFNAARFHQCERDNSPSLEKFPRLSRYAAWTVVFLTCAALLALWRLHNRPARHELFDIATLASIGIAWPTYVLWFAFMKRAESKRRRAKLQEDVDSVEDEHGNAVPWSGDGESREQSRPPTV